jgi:NAD(P)-dependent dehydrogenase (short-subunit alcohol dehydrogenase family)
MSDIDFSPSAFFGLTGCNILVTGAAGQIGSRLVDATLASGANVIAGDFDLAALENTKETRQWADDKLIIGECDIRKKEHISALIQAGEDRFGAVDSLINNAGVSVFEPFMERPEESIDWVMDVNLKGTIFCIQEFNRHRGRHGGKGAIVNIASHYGIVSPDPRIYTDLPRRNSEIYGATKAGIIQLTRYFAVHLAEEEIRVNGVAPGGVRNPDSPQGEEFQKHFGNRCPMGRMAEIHEIVGACVFLLSPAASYVNGHTIVVDGGMTSW